MVIDHKLYCTLFIFILSSSITIYHFKRQSAFHHSLSWFRDGIKCLLLLGSVLQCVWIYLLLWKSCVCCDRLQASEDGKSWHYDLLQQNVHLVFWDRFNNWIPRGILSLQAQRGQVMAIVFGILFVLGQSDLFFRPRTEQLTNCTIYLTLWMASMGSRGIFHIGLIFCRDDYN